MSKMLGETVLKKSENSKFCAIDYKGDPDVIRRGQPIVPKRDLFQGLFSFVMTRPEPLRQPSPAGRHRQRTVLRA
jgi:hypothetical protein